MRHLLVGILAVYLVTTIGLFEQSNAAIVLALVGGLLGISFAVVSPLYPKALAGAVATGFLLALSGLLVTETPFIDGNRESVGAFMLLCAVFPSPRSLAAGDSAH